VPRDQHRGTGTFLCAKNEAVYCGQYKGNRFHGIGVLTFADGSVYGSVYRGEYKEGLREGHGVLQLLDAGDVYCGQWKGGKQEGHAVLTFDEGSVFRGHKVDQREGHGVLHLDNGDVYCGQWNAWGKQEGPGVYQFADGRRTFVRWEGGEYVSSVPFDAANPVHAAAACDAEARRIGTGAHGCDRGTSRSAQAAAMYANNAEVSAEAVAVRIVPHARTVIHSFCGCAHLDRYRAHLGCEGCASAGERG
jgi:hypothetical protein